MAETLDLIAPRWTRHAACQLDPDLWFDDRQAQLAAHVCRVHCTVLAECRTATDERPEEYGIWAGVAWTRHQGQARISGTQPARTRCSAACDRWTDRG